MLRKAKTTPLATAASLTLGRAAPPQPQLSRLTRGAVPRKCETVVTANRRSPRAEEIGTERSHWVNRTDSPTYARVVWGAILCESVSFFGLRLMSFTFQHHARPPRLPKGGRKAKMFSILFSLPCLLMLGVFLSAALKPFTIPFKVVYVLVCKIGK